MPQLMPFFWVNSVCMVFFVLEMVMIVYFTSELENQEWMVVLEEINFKLKW